MVNCRVGLLITVLDEPKNKVFLFVSEVCSFSLEQLPPQQAWKQASLASHGDRTLGEVCSNGVMEKKSVSIKQLEVKILFQSCAEPCPWQGLPAVPLDRLCQQQAECSCPLPVRSVC